MSKVIQTTCPYCGVGCGLLVEQQPDGQTRIRGNPEHPANFGRLCSKGSALGETLDLDGRLLYPQINGERVNWDRALDRVAGALSQAVQTFGPDSVAFYVSGQLLTEDYYAANKLMKGFIGSANIDTNSRLCMASSVAAYRRAFGSDSVPCDYEDLDQAQMIVLVGSNTAWCHPVLYQRMAAARKRNAKMRIVVIDPRRTASCDIADLHLPLQPGTDALLFNGLLRWLHDNGYANQDFLDHCTAGGAEALAVAHDSGNTAEVADACGVAEQDLLAFYRLFAANEQVVTAWSQGVNQSSHGVDKANAIINCHLLTGRIGRPGMGPFSLTGQPNAMGGREVGGLANQLAAHMELDNAEHRNIVQKFWNSPSIAERPGMKAVELFRAAEQGHIKVLWIMATNPVDSLPDADRVRRALQRCELVIVSDCVQNTDTTNLAHILLPSLTWGEKDGTVTNSERRISRQRAFLPAPGEARADWWIVSEVARRMGFAEAFPWQRPADIFREHAALSASGNNGQRDFDIGALAELGDQAYEVLQPVQWPISTAAKGACRKLFADGRYYTSDRRARLVAVSWQAPANSVDADFPLILNTGRVRDQWHTMTRTGKVPRLTEHSPEPFVEIHPDDAKRYGVEDGQLAWISSRFGEVVVRVQVRDSVPVGVVFVPMHWNDQSASFARIGAVVNPDTDAISGQPELKYTPVRIRPFDARWFGFILCRRRLDTLDSEYWARVHGQGFYRYEIAGSQSPGAWPRWARQLLCTDHQDVEWVEYMDEKVQRYRGVRLRDKRLESCIFIAPGQQLPSRQWLADLFALTSLPDEERMSLLAGSPGGGREDQGKLVCACYNVGINTLHKAIREQHLCSVEEIGASLKAGTGCGSCIPELRDLVALVNKK